MPLPDGLPTSALSFGPYTDLAGGAAYAGAEGTITPVHPETKRPIALVHVATGQVVVPRPIPIVLGEDTTLVTDPLPRSGTGQISPDNFLLSVQFSSPRAPEGRLIRLLSDAEAVVDYDRMTLATSESAIYPQTGEFEQRVLAVLASRGLDKLFVGSSYPESPDAGTVFINNSST